MKTHNCVITALLLMVVVGKSLIFEVASSAFRMRCLHSTENQNFPVNSRLKILCLHGYLSSAEEFKQELSQTIEYVNPLSEFGVCFSLFIGQL